MKRALSSIVQTRAFRIFVSPLVTVFLIGWLGSDSCYVAYCKEDCDPCLQQCKCTHSCSQTSATFQATHALTEFEVVDRADDGARLRRTFTEVMGLSVQRAGGPPQPGADDIVRFARGVLAVNAVLLAHPDCEPPFELDSITGYETAWVVQFHQEPRAGTRASTNAQGFLFDARGNLIEIDQTSFD